MPKRMMAAVAVLAVASLGACAPTMRVAVVSPSCGPHQPWTTHSRDNMTSAMQRLQRLQAQYRAGFRYEQRTQSSWRAAATGECRY